MGGRDGDLEGRQQLKREGKIGWERVRLGEEAATETRGKEWVGESETWRGGSN